MSEKLITLSLEALLKSIEKREQIREAESRKDKILKIEAENELNILKHKHIYKKK